MSSASQGDRAFRGRHDDLRYFDRLPVDAADAVDSLIFLQNPTARLAAAAFDVGAVSVARAQRLSPKEREKVRRGEHPLVLPRVPNQPVLPLMPSIPPVPPATYEPPEQLARLVAQHGLDAVFDMLAAIEKVAA